MGPQDVRTYFFSHETDRYVALERVQVDPDQQVVSSLS